MLQVIVASINLIFFSYSDVQARDHNGCSALHYATLINSSLADEIIHILVEALGHTGTHLTHTYSDISTLYSLHISLS